LSQLRNAYSGIESEGDDCMSYQELFETYRHTKHMMMNARDKYERAVWMNMFRWAVSEIRRMTTAGTVVTQNKK
jgi:hypothetical protein